MANTFTDLLPILYESLDTVSREQVGFIPAVFRDSSAEVAAKDQTINVPVSDAITATDITPGTNPGDNGDTAPGNVELKITKSRQAPVRWTGEDEKQLLTTDIGRQVTADRFAQAMRTLTNEVETDLGALYTDTSRGYGTAATVPFGTINELDDSAQLLKILEDNGAPDSDLHLVLGTGAIANMRGIQAALYKVNESGSDAALRRGEIGDLHGWALHKSAKIATHTAGTAASATTDNSGYAVGATILTLASAGTGTVLVGDIVTFAGDTNQYTIKTGDSDVSDGGTIVLQEPGLRVAMSAATKAITMVATHTAHMGFDRNAIALVTRAPAMPTGGDAADDVATIVDPESNLAFQVAMYKQYRQVKFEVGLAWGTKVIAPRHIARLVG